MTVAEAKTAHLRAVVGIAEGQPGAMFFASPTRARFLIGRHEAELVNAGPAPADTGILRRCPSWPMDRFSTVLPAWIGKTAVIVGGGPSLTMDQIALVESARAADRIRVIAVNDSYLICPFADVFYAADSSFWLDHARGIAKPVLKLSADRVRERFEAFSGERCSIQSTGAMVEDSRVHLIRNKHCDSNGRPIHGHGLSLDPGALVTGRNSGWQAFNLAVLAGARTVILLGIDGRVGKDGRTHWSGGHPQPTPVAAYAEYCRAWSAGEAAIKAANVKVLNSSPGSAVGFEKMALQEALCAPGI
ncbi:MAG: hypothetical protein ACTS6J_01940 [Burkholderiales bacterium]